MNHIKTWRYALISICVVALDQAAKFWAKTSLAGHPVVLIPNFLALTYNTNQGAAFGIMQKQWVIFIGLNLAFFFLVWKYYHSIPKRPFILSGLFLALGGACGNLIDRIFFKAVTDFICFSFWPVFNVADSSIVIGLFMLCWGLWRHDQNGRKLPGTDWRRPD
ncbi:MAG: signal peptidase II [Bacillota bacterium]